MNRIPFLLCLLAAMTALVLVEASHRGIIGHTIDRFTHELVTQRTGEHL